MSESTRPSRSGPNPNLVDVARHAGVSRGTVSNVLNYPERVVPKTLERVRRAIDELGYVRNDAARALAAGTSASIGFVSTNIENSLFVDMIYGAQLEAHAKKMSILVGNSGDDLAQQDAYLDVFDQARVAGVLLAAMEDPSSGIERMRSHGRQIVLLNYRPPNHDCCVVLTDNEQVGYLAARHLIELGRKHLAYVAGHEHWQPVHDRRIGVRRAIAETKGAVRLQEVPTAHIDFEDGLEYGQTFLNTDASDRPDGIVAVTDAVAGGILQHLMAVGGIRVPEDVAVIGCENNRSAPRGPITLTVIETPGCDMGVAATSLLMEEISSSPDDHQHRTITVQPHLVARASTGSPVSATP